MHYREYIKTYIFEEYNEAKNDLLLLYVHKDITDPLNLKMIAYKFLNYEHRVH